MSEKAWGRSKVLGKVAQDPEPPKIAILPVIEPGICPKCGWLLTQFYIDSEQSCYCGFVNYDEPEDKSNWRKSAIVDGQHHNIMYAGDSEEQAGKVIRGKYQAPTGNQPIGTYKMHCPLDCGQPMSLTITFYKTHLTRKKQAAAGKRYACSRKHAIWVRIDDKTGSVTWC